ncbi:TPA: type-F conjugative transfer system pilin assembly protein TraF, partial [Klebsiella pneumoniae]|nr:type-F conjugative transfer system pilin assembly protein TraF [Klebsiella pneumoniae]
MRTIHAAMLAGCLCCALMPAFAKDAGWQWYNEKLKPRDEERKAAPAAPPPQMDIL